MAAQRAISHPNLIPGTENLAERERFGRFLSAGTLGTILDFSLLTLLKLSGIPTLNANSLSFSADVLNDFAMEQVLDIQRLTDFGLAHTNAEIWHSQPDRTVIEQRDHPLFRSSLEPISDNFGWGFLPAMTIATEVVVFWNYFAIRCRTFRISASPSTERI